MHCVRIGKELVFLMGSDNYQDTAKNGVSTAIYANKIYFSGGVSAE